MDLEGAQAIRMGGRFQPLSVVSSRAPGLPRANRANFLPLIPPSGTDETDLSPSSDPSSISVFSVISDMVLSLRSKSCHVNRECLLESFSLFFPALCLEVLLFS